MFKASIYLLNSPVLNRGFLHLKIHVHLKTRIRKHSKQFVQRKNF